MDILDPLRPCQSFSYPNPASQELGRWNCTREWLVVGLHFNSPSAVFTCAVADPYERVVAELNLPHHSGKPTRVNNLNPDRPLVGLHESVRAQPWARSVPKEPIDSYCPQAYCKSEGSNATCYPIGWHGRRDSRDPDSGPAADELKIPVSSAHCPRWSIVCKGMRLADYEEAVEAARRWIVEHGRYPKQYEWEHQAPGRPTTRTIKRRWGWEELMRAAVGAGARSPKLEPRRQRRLELLLTLRRAREELGRWPEAWEWEFATETHASRRSYVRHFGSWRRACRMAARVRL